MPVGRLGQTPGGVLSPHGGPAFRRNALQVHPLREFRSTSQAQVFAFWTSVFAFPVLVFTFPASVFTFRTSVFTFPAWVFAFRAWVLTFRAWVFAFRALVFAFRAWVFTFRAWVFALRAWVFTFRAGRIGNPRAEAARSKQWWSAPPTAAHGSQRFFASSE